MALVARCSFAIRRGSPAEETSTPASPGGRQQRRHAQNTLGAAAAETPTPASPDGGEQRPRAQNTPDLPPPC